MSHTLTEITLMRATLADAPYLVGLIDKFARQNLLLKQTLEEITYNINNFTVARVSTTQEIIGCVLLYRYTDKLGEVRSLCVEDDYQGQGIAKKLVLASLEIAREAKMHEVISFTIEAKSFFEKLGFEHILRREVPEKVVKDCKQCVCYGNCQAQLYQFKITPSLHKETSSK